MAPAAARRLRCVVRRRALDLPPVHRRERSSGPAHRARHPPSRHGPRAMERRPSGRRAHSRAPLDGVVPGRRPPI
eukprot:5491774-Heterocapsa_arctica.AAC.1